MDLCQYQAQKPFSQKHMLYIQEYTSDEICQILSLALDLKQKQKQGLPHPYLQGKTLGLIFAKSSTRTRVSFEIGIRQLGGYGIFLNSADIQLGRGETIEDTARVLSRYVDGIMIRTFKQSDVDALAEYGSIPIINGLTDFLHPCQILADLMTIYEHKGTLKGLKLAFIGDGNNVANTLLIGCSKMGMDISIGCPEQYKPDAAAIQWAQENAVKSGSCIIITQDPMKAIQNADVVYTDVWTSMGQEKEAMDRCSILSSYQVNEKLFENAHKDAIFLHCLPAHRGEEVTTGIIDSPRSVVFDEAENRLHAQKAIMVLLMK